MAPDERRAEVLRAALAAAQVHGWASMTRDQIAAVGGVSNALVSARLGDMPAVRDAVMAEAVRQQVLSVIAEGIALRHKLALKAPAELRDRALASLSTAR